jgi:hypothetical protein
MLSLGSKSPQAVLQNIPAPLEETYQLLSLKNIHELKGTAFNQSKNVRV